MRPIRSTVPGLLGLALLAACETSQSPLAIDQAGGVVSFQLLLKLAHQRLGGLRSEARRLGGDEDDAVLGAAAFFATSHHVGPVSGRWRRREVVDLAGARLADQRLALA